VLYFYILSDPNSLTLLTFQTIIMKNFGSILTLLAISASLVSGRALPSSEDGLEAREPLPVGEHLAAIRKNIIDADQSQKFSLVHQRRIRLLVSCT
jgi:hypothetical protein